MDEMLISEKRSLHLIGVENAKIWPIKMLISKNKTINRSSPLN